MVGGDSLVLISNLFIFQCSPAFIIYSRAVLEIYVCKFILVFYFIFVYNIFYKKKVISINPDNINAKNEFEKWKKIVQAKIKDYKQGKITEDGLYNRMIA